MTDNDTPPAGNEAEMSPTPLSEVFASRQEAPEAPEAGSGSDLTAEPATAAPQAAPAAPEAPQAAQSPASLQSPPAAEAGEPKPPKWYRDHMAQVNRERLAEKAEFERLRAAQPQPQRQVQQQPNLPDPLEDPAAYAHAIREETRREFQSFQLQTTLTLSERFARQQHGTEAFEECRAWLTTKPDIEAWAIQQPDPWTAAFTQYQRERLVEEIGDDPAAYRERLRNEFLAEQAAAATQQQSPAPAPSMRSAPPPPSSTARAAAPRDPGGRFTGPTPLTDIFATNRR